MKSNSVLVTLSLALCYVLHAHSSLQAEDWRQFRGTNVNAIATGEELPSQLDQENLAWRIDLQGRGVSCPIVVGDRLFLTSSSGVEQNRLHVQCFQVSDGQQLWERQFWATGRTMCHKKMCVATPTPASDGKRIFAFYSSNDLVCLDLDGNLQWFRGLTHDYPNASNSLGMSSSPIVIGETVIVQVESDAEAFAAGIDVQTGIQRWKISRPRRANWTSPTILKVKGKAFALLQSSAGLHAVDPESGKVVWSYESGASTIPSNTVDGETIYVPSKGITALKPGNANKKFNISWNSGRLQPSTPSPIVSGGKVYTVNRAGALTCAETNSGDVLWQLRLKGPFSSTPVLAGNHLYFISEGGLIQVVDLSGEKGNIVDSHGLEETILATPAVSNNALYVRSDTHLWKFTK